MIINQELITLSLNHIKSDMTLILNPLKVALIPLVRNYD